QIVEIMRYAAGEPSNIFHPPRLLESGLRDRPSRREIGDKAQRAPDPGTKNGVKHDTAVPRAEGDLLVDRIGHIDRVGCEMPPPEEMRHTSRRCAPFFVLNAAGNGLHQL